MSESEFNAGATSPKPVDRTSPWVVLIVDDEPEVHAVTRMMLSRTRFHGAPVELHSAYSAAEARRLLRQECGAALILLDVVMETDDAGLRFCRYVREELGNDDVQIILRTGQPGQAPEREVVLNYGINGYFLKTEITAQKLHSILIAALRTYDRMNALKNNFEFPSRPGELSRDYGTDMPVLLNTAIERGELALVAEPQVELSSGAVAAVELGICWQTQVYGDVPHRDIMLIAERSGLERTLGNWVLHQAGSTHRAWQQIGAEPMRMSIDVSAAHLACGDLVETVGRCLEDSSLPPELLELEIAEGTVMAELRPGRATLHDLKALGVGIAVDDCGVGFASLSRLKALQADRLKIHRALVKGVTSDPDSAAIARALIALAHTLQMSVVAEGVETLEQLEFLKWEACELAQGPFFCAPISMEQLPKLLDTPLDRVQ